MSFSRRLRKVKLVLSIESLFWILFLNPLASDGEGKGFLTCQEMVFGIGRRVERSDAQTLQAIQSGG